MREVILDANKHMGWNKIYEAINDCFGTDYSGWMSACWPNGKGNGKFRVWFNKLAIRDGNKLRAATNDCVNTISPDWNEFVFDELRNRHPDPSVFYAGYDLIFSKDVGGQYIFRGIFKLDKEKSSPNHCVSKRVATKVKVIGEPANDIELLDDLSVHGDINVPLIPKAINADNDGRIIVTCGNCEAVFKKAPRCPECGQLVEY